MNFPQTTVWFILWKCLLLKAYKLQAISASFKTELQSQAVLVLLWASREREEADVVQHVVSSDEISFHLDGKAKRQNIPYWGFQNTHNLTDHARLSPNVNICYIVYDKEI